MGKRLVCCLTVKLGVGVGRMGKRLVCCLTVKLGVGVGGWVRGLSGV